MKQVVTVYDLIGCKDGCAHRLPSTETKSTRKADRFGHETYQLIEVTPHCAKTNECSARRQEIYARADASRGGAKSSKQAHKRWAEIAREYTDQPCPFFKSVNN